MNPAVPILPVPSGSRRDRRNVRPKVAATGVAGLLIAAAALTSTATAAPAAAAVAAAGVTSSFGAHNVYATTNGALGNAVRTFHRQANGRLTLVGDTPTGGSGSGSFEQSANALVLGGVNGESSPNTLTTQERFLFAVNTGSGTVSVLRADGDRVTRVHTQPTGDHPLSVSVNRGLVYVLNGGTTSGMGGLPTITGFRLSGTGTLTPIPGSTQPVSGGPASGSTQVSFNPAGTVLVVTEKAANVLTSYPVNSAGVAGAPISNANSPGSIGPFGFTFTKDGTLLTAENAGGAPGLGGAASFRVTRDAKLTPIGGGTVSNGQSDTCWIVLTDNQRFAYATNAQSNNISSYRVDAAGRLTLLKGNAAKTDELPAVGPSILPGDLTLSRDSQYLYERNVMDGDLNTYAVGADGSLRLVQRLEHALPAGAIGVAGT